MSIKNRLNLEFYEIEIENPPKSPPDIDINRL
jgi:hypothetical protein